MMKCGMCFGSGNDNCGLILWLITRRVIIGSMSCVNRTGGVSRKSHTMEGGSIWCLKSDLCNPTHVYDAPVMARLFYIVFICAGFSDSPRRKFRKGDRSRRMWIPREEEIMAATLLDLVARGWKADNGFRAGYQQRIEDSIRTEFPNSDIKGNPQVTSRILAWKKHYTSLRGILNRSGVGFTVDYRIDCDDDQWEQICQVHIDPLLHIIWFHTIAGCMDIYVYKVEN